MARKPTRHAGVSDDPAGERVTGGNEGPALTDRQQIMQAISGQWCSARDLARLLRMPERRVEEHLTHIVRSLSKDRTRQFVIDPATCDQCGFVFRTRVRLTRPSRCPQCHSEHIAAPRFEIRPRA